MSNSSATPTAADGAATVVLGDYRHTEQMKTRSMLGGTPVVYPSIVPVWDAFDAMVRTQSYTVSEMAIVALLQAHDAGKPLLLLPVSMVGGFHHRSMVASPVAPPNGPADLVGRRVGIRSYSQTTGLWVRAILLHEYGVDPRDITWVVTENSHSELFADPPNVEFSTMSLEDGLRSGSLSAAVLGRQASKDLAPLIPDAKALEKSWFDRHQLVPINHMVVTTTEAVENNAAFVRALYDALADEIELSRASRSSVPGRMPSGTEYGIKKMRRAVELAASYAVEQGLISKKPEIDSLFVPSSCLSPSPEAAP
jgi:4,5-dihydroxyphthalate decarboxylase